MMQYRFKKDIYPKIAVLKAAYNYTDKAFVHLDADDMYYYVNLDMKDDNNIISEKDFQNELLAQVIRHEVYLQTKNIRELLLARAMATTVVVKTDNEQTKELFEDTDSEQDILKDWFENHDT